MPIEHYKEENRGKEKNTDSARLRKASLRCLTKHCEAQKSFCIREI